MRFLACVVLGLLLTLASARAAKPDFPALTGRIVDNANIIDTATETRLTDRLQRHEQETGEQLVIVTVPGLNDLPIEDFGYQLGRHWGIGQKDKNNGVLFIIAPKERQVRIETGYGVEGRLTDAASSIIINNVVLPAFRAGDMSRGIVDGTSAILDTLADPDSVKTIQASQAQKTQQGIPLKFLLLLLLFLWLIRRSGRRGSLLTPLVFGSLLERSGGGFSGGSNTGFFGGGGSFGGGGASGRW